ncbi:hypothetical protein F5B21DRAFT_477422 [Xylaria acuta]|nr:hypothetical protein F5B21DRAFT_477422 [Xylaria acuta]
MIARGAPVGAVCLRCRLRLRLLGQLTPIRYVASDASNTHRVFDLASDRTDGEHVVRQADQDQGSKARSGSRPGTRRLNLRKQHISGNRVLDEGAASLGSDMLGKPAYAIVMRDGGNVRRRKFPSAPGENESKPDPSANLATTIEALLDSQREPPTLHEVRSNIHGLRPKRDKVLPEKEFGKLRRLLTSGFLSAQLRDYIEWHKSGAWRESQETTADGSSPPEFPWILQRSPWVPLQTQPNAVKGTDPALQGYILDSIPAKERLAVRLMRECWELSIAELETQLGEISIKLHNHEFTLLLRGTQRFMNTLGKIWLEPGEKIEAFRNQKTLRLVTTKPKAETLIRDLDETLRSVMAKTFPVNLVASEPPDDTVLEELGRITNAHVRKNNTSRKLRVTWIELKSRAARGLTTLEDMAHIVMRLLLTASGSQQPTSTLLSPIVSQERPGRFIVDATSKDKLAWKDRLSQWARFVHPVTPEKESAAHPALPIKEFELPLEPIERAEALNGNLDYFPETKFPAQPVKWSEVLRTSTVACFGQVLHPYQSSNPTPLLSELLASADRRVFAPATPHPLYLSRFETSGSDSSPPLVTTKSTILLRFWPSPSSNPASNKSAESSHAGDAPPAPVLELRLAASDREVRGVESLRAINRAHHTDVMLPSSPVDVRFTQTQYETLQGPDRDALIEWQPLTDFLKHARLDLANSKLEVPPRQRFPVPRRLFASKPSSPTPPPTEGGTDLAGEMRRLIQQEEFDDHVSVSYEFVGLEFHRSATLPYNGHQLTYTSIEAGQGGGRRAEVTLEPMEPLHSTTPATEAANEGTLQEDFLECCSRFVADRSLWSGISDRKR